MRRGAILAMILIATLGLGVGVVLAAGAFSSQPIRHENPATALVENQPGAVFEYFLTAFSQLNARRYQYGRQLISQLSRASLRPDVTSIVNDLNESLVKEGSLVETTERWVRDIAD